MHEGWVSTRLGLKGIPSASEENMVARDIALARQTGAHVHIAHLSTAGAVELVRRAKAEGVRVTAEVTPHHLALTHEAVMHRNPASAAGQRALAYDTNAKMYPPLRGGGGRARRASRACATAQSTRSPRTTRRTPCRRSSASSTTRRSASIGLETALALSLTRRQLARRTRAIEALTHRAGARARPRPLAAGHRHAERRRAGDVVLLDPAREWTVEPRDVRLEGQEHAASAADAARAGGRDGLRRRAVVYALEKEWRV